MTSVRKRFLCVGLILLALGVMFVGTRTLAATSKAPITINAILNAESLGYSGDGGATFSPDGKSLAFARILPISGQNSWGYDDADFLVRQNVYVMRPGTQNPVEIPNTQDVHYSFLLNSTKAWAPDSQGLLVMAASRTGYGLAYYDVGSGKITRLPGHPAILFPYFDWTRDGRVIYAVMPKGGHQRVANQQVLANLNERWSQGWHGHAEVTVSSDNPAFRSSSQASGELMLADPRHDSVKRIAGGDYTVINVDPNGPYVATIREAERIPHALNDMGRRNELQIFKLTSTGDMQLQHSFPDLDVATSIANGASFAWSASGRRLLFVGKPASAATRDAHLYVVDVKTGNVQRISSHGLSFLHFSGAGEPNATLPIGWLGNRPIAIAAHTIHDTEEPRQNPGTSTQHIYGQAQNLRFDLYVFGQDKPVDLSTFSKESIDRFLVSPGGNAMLIVADGALWRVSPGSLPHRVSPDDGVTITGFGIDRRIPEPPTSSAYYHAGTVERIALYGVVHGDKSPHRFVLNLADGRMQPLKATGDILDTAPDQLKVVTKVTKGWRASLLLCNGGDQRTLMTVNGNLKNKAVATVKSFQYKYRDEPLTGWVVLPLDAEPGTRPPAVVSVYGGSVYGSTPPAAATTSFFVLPAWSGQLLATQGYAVIYPSLPLEPGSGSNLMQTLAGESVAAVDALAAKGMIDPRRVGVIGQSFGGYSTAAILAARSDRFKAGVSLAGMYGLISGYGMRPLADIFSNASGITAYSMSYAEKGQPRLGKPFWQTPEAYMRNSPIFHVEDINSPLLMLHGDLDSGMSGIANAERMYNAMVRAGKKPVLVRYWGQGHVAQAGWALRDQWLRVKHWFGYYLKGEVAPKK